MKDRLLKIWRDPVWSKVISVALIALGTLTYNWAVSKFEKTDFNSVFLQFWTQKISLWIIVFFIAIVLLIYLLWSKWRDNKTINFKYDSETLELDRAFFNKIRNELLTQDMIIAPRSNAFSSHSFPDKSLYDILEILHESKKSDFEFINPQLDKLKSELINAIEQFNIISMEYIFGAGQSGWLGIPREWDMDRFYKAANDISSHEKIICDRYDNLIREGRRLLKI
jgi:hypothetical protein